MTTRHPTIRGCSSQQPTRTRNQGGYLLRLNGEGLLFDPGEGTQRQFIYAHVAPTVVTRIFISHFHGDHCLGLGSMLMRLNLDRVTHEIHCYYPASGKTYFDRLRYGTIYHEQIHVVEHPVEEAGVVHDDGSLRVEAAFLEHGTPTLAWRITEPDTIKFDSDKLAVAGIRGPDVARLSEAGHLISNGSEVRLDDVSWIRRGRIFATVIDTGPCKIPLEISRGADLLLAESTYLDDHKALARSHRHMTARQAAELARDADAGHLVLTHFSARYPDLRPFLREARPIFSNTDVAEDCKQFPFPR